MERVAICGVMASGKTHLADVLVQEKRFTKFSLATGVKDLARDVFLMEGKDRKLLQQVGMKMREIQPKVWINLLMRRVAEYSNSLKWAGDLHYDPDLATGVVEYGKMKLMDSADSPDFTQHTVSPSTNIVYNPS